MGRRERKQSKNLSEKEKLLRIVDTGYSQFIPEWFWILAALAFWGWVGYFAYDLMDPVLSPLVLVSALIIFTLLTRYIIINNGSYAVITTERLVYYNRLGFFKKNIVELYHHPPRPVSCRYSGFLPYIARMGEVVIDRGNNSEDSLVLKFVHKPEKVQNLLVKLQRDYIYVREGIKEPEKADEDEE